MSEQARAHIIVSGLVQGVFYRASTADFARKLSVCGWVKNLNDGKVEIMAEGEKQNLEKFVEWCRKGPPHASVSGVDVNWQKYSGEFNSFSGHFASAQQPSVVCNDSHQSHADSKVYF